MAEALERSEAEIMPLEEDHLENPYTPARVLGVALLGALGGLLLYYLYNQLDTEQRENIKETLVKGLKAQARSWAGDAP
jgi:hypothetical protein